MKITVEIGGNDYTFEMNRMVYKQLLGDTEYSKMQNEITKRVKSKNIKGKNVEEVGEELVVENVSEVLLRNMVMEEQIFYYSLLTNQPDMTMKKAGELLEVAYCEYGKDEVGSLTAKLMENFTQSGEQTKKKMAMRII